MAKTDKIYQYKKDYESDLEAHDKYTTDWDSLEAMLISKPMTLYLSRPRMVSPTLTLQQC